MIIKDQKHTSEPWYACGGDIVSVASNLSIMTDVNANEVEFNARRIAQCVNALSGKNPDKLSELIDAAGDVLLKVPSHLEPAPSRAHEALERLLTALAAYNGDASDE